MVNLACGECGAPMVLRYSAKFARRFYGCSRWPDCNGTHGAHPNGDPLGIPADRATKLARQRAHEAFDRLWRGSGALMSRTEAYSWLGRVMNLSKDEAHIGRFSVEQCETLHDLAAKMLDQLPMVVPETPNDERTR